jgi:adenosylcobinamide kinase / adenosylcobinamide-phosphate guanylyltransferase
VGEVWFVTGGARSGKSSFAQQLAASTGHAVVFVATMEPLDEELVARVSRHRAERPPAWQTVEVPADVVRAVETASSEACVLLDCLSLWVANRLLALGDEPSQAALATLETALDEEVDALLAIAETRDAPTIVVSNEVGAGVVPESPLGRAYRDLLGRVNQRAAASATRAWLLVAGRALPLPDAAPWQTEGPA